MNRRMTQSLQYRKHRLSSQDEQRKVLEENSFASGLDNNFANQVADNGLGNYLYSGKLEILQLNLGYLCNQTCKHCHVDAGPDRKELMDRATLAVCLDICQDNQIPTLDITGGAPEMHPDFCWLVQEADGRGVDEIIVRSNLTILVSHPKYRDLAEFFANHGVHVISSLPFYQPERTDRQRGSGVFEKSIEALTMLNGVGYAIDESLQLDLVYNPSGAFLPGGQKQLEQEFKQELKQNFGIDFNHLFTLTNLPISRFLDFLVASGNYEEYMEKLVQSFNPATIENLMCRNTLSVDYRGHAYDCDFNQMLGIPVASSCFTHVKDFSLEKVEGRQITTGQHCYGCTAGAGSSCQGALA